MSRIRSSITALMRVCVCFKIPNQSDEPALRLTDRQPRENSKHAVVETADNFISFHFVSFRNLLRRSWIYQHCIEKKQYIFSLPVAVCSSSHKYGVERKTAMNRMNRPKMQYGTVRYGMVRYTVRWSNNFFKEENIVQCMAAIILCSRPDACSEYIWAGNIHRI